MSLPVVIVGAGLSGLVAAQVLVREGLSCVVVDKGRSPGGRLATRRLLGLDGRTAHLDHGAQFFTVRSPEFGALVAEWSNTGVVSEWCRGFDDQADGFPRYFAGEGMNSLAKWLARDLDVRCGKQVRSVAGGDGPFGGELSVTDLQNERLVTTSVLLTAPVPQSLALIDNGWLAVSDNERTGLHAVRYAPCLGLLVTTDRPTPISVSGGRQLDESTDPTWSFIGDNMAKGISAIPAVTFHANEAASTAWYDEPPEVIEQNLLVAAQHYLGSARVVKSEVKKWRYARPTVQHQDRCVITTPIVGTTLVFAGDAFGEPRVEGAALSGMAAAAAILKAVS